ncbi:hypothetical protein B0T16DRAFT_461946 [Cercophora newfieldiana]|uniref:Uncharacterized protein n=1 Tax=Cercophora newfieldiana TaxID=92897 RepID=A0AA39XX67_9PEZI|nr:hypothetical protein B0T16DRAFT_461946 [Cercophora newfieldiana]
MYLPSLLSLLTLNAPLLGYLPSVAGQVLREDAPIFIEAGFENATATDTTYNTGGTITVGGFTMQIPKNLLVQFPAAWVPWKDFVADHSSFLGFETLVLGNTVLGVPLVGQVIMTEFFEGVSSGHIASVNYTDGSLQIENGPLVRISDPNGVFSVGYAGAPFMTADDQNPSITAFSGFPMCIPRNASDPLCPLSNRPSAAPTSFTAPDPLVMAPFLPGDFITINGFRPRNAPSEVIAYAIVAENVQILTPPSVIYIRTELALLGISSPNPASEVASSRFKGFTSHPAATVTLSAIDIDPCTGTTSDRMISSFTLRGGRNFQNKWEYRNEIFSGYTREYRATVELNGVPLLRRTKNGLMAGTYVSPVNVWVPAELEIPGMAPVVHEFAGMGWLSRGVGRDAEGRMWGALEPFPQSGVSLEEVVCEEVEVGVKRRAGLRKRRTFGSRVAEIEVQAQADAEPATVVVAPEEEAEIQEQEELEEVKVLEELELELELESV